MGDGAEGSGAFAQDVAGGGGVEAEDGPEQDGFGLVRRIIVHFSPSLPADTSSTPARTGTMWH